MIQVKAKKQFGQNFLKDMSVLTKIIQAIPNNSNHIVEIGPGLGDLTEKLVKYKEVTAYEVDRDLYAILCDKFQKEREQEQLKIVLGDVLEAWEKSSLFSERKYDLIANLPYYIATNIILKAFDDKNCEHIIVMVQKEVADKFVAKVKDKEFSSLGILTTIMSVESKILVTVPPESFDPAPKVDSAVIYIKKDMTASVEDGFKKFLKLSFTQPRKKLLKNLSAGYNKDFVKSVLEELEIKENARPHEIDAPLYNRIYKRIQNNGRNKE
ncbi:MAG: 16S rRNA (adenine(1518)-N(6)/adenine(1519)-N(6))-dimethyltransferase RsmA [Campylobacteraceae bacterium]|jgi:16S rRNA (adenine1518-N6/adenine1519-N6)-dimethyltransferase|nr:16S rRNA (adenine(1518)-N(6)/adenine(1519)-N(6))-dimethyltransferase RsmA [Campylobacteraceae bacterium]MBT3882171.1 16S rRNA (adenine(1518)-N(6)/adenine(1519)-N(6))-dimethyltransferase RsmA [Campylobacteraceae bacterium]MBT4031278.1 16S rRNA (adenine(1518)-N(6)/adenine(1519)-N(6))-dimethyltransferase RsmA [Campylobacteraceae bacterium]MBT4179121.1 16S rRNA (adenine(1518)-N(6)/adenine(1519)-N(6))-dimethyltransferase RsmA [Campylobacteraceae bacterium]MBT4572556.1 16S rRNA (adenine(1518)-N(6)